MKTRKVIQIAATSDEGYNTPYALCNDGTTWSYNETEGVWHKLPAIPQPPDEEE